MLQAVAKLEDIIAISALAIFSLIIFIGVVFRYALNYPLGWTNELSLILFAWMMFIGAAICVRRNEHILIDLLLAKPETVMYRVTEIIAAAFTCIAAAVLCYASFFYMLGSASMVTPVFRISSAIYNSAAPVGFLLIFVHSSTHLWTKIITNHKQEVSSTI